MISIGQLAGRAIAGLWRRRFAVLGLMLAWLALDGFLLGYLSAFHPSFLLVLPRGLVQFVDRQWLLSDWFQILLLLPQQYLRDLIRAVFVVLLLRTLLAPLSAQGARAKSGLIVPVLLVLAFEFAWTTVVFPIDLGLTLAISRAAENGSVDGETLEDVSILIRGVFFACCALAMSRLCFVYPNAAIDGALWPRQSWRETGGLAARLFLLFLAVPIPFFLLGGIMNVLIVQYEFTVETYQYLQLCLLIVDSVQDVLASTVILAVVAVAYVAATGHGAAAIPGGGRSSGQLAEAFD